MLPFLSRTQVNNVFLRDENVNGKAIRLALAAGVQILRDVDIDIHCDIRDYDQCLFDYAVANGYIIVTANKDDFEPKFYKYAESGADHPGIVFIRPEHYTSAYQIAEWLQLLADEKLTNRIERIPPP